MNEIPQIAPVSDMHHKQTELFAKMETSPVILAQRSKARAVLVSIEQWNRLVGELRRARLSIKAQQTYQRNNEAESWVTSDELLTRLADHHDPSIIEKIKTGLPNHVAG